MADKKISELTSNSAPGDDALLVIVTDPSGTPANKKIRYGDFLRDFNANVAFTSNTVISRLFVANNNILIQSNNTPANSTPSVQQGTIMYDSSYIYVATANNVLKRVTLSSF